MYGTKKNQNISKIYFDPRTDILRLANEGRVIFMTTGCKLSLITAGSVENLMFLVAKTRYCNISYLQMQYFVIYLNKAHFPLVVLPSGNKSNDFSSCSFDINCFNTVLSWAVFALGKEDTSPKKYAIGKLNILVG